MKLIDKDVLVAEIERRQKEEVSYYENGSFASWADENHYFTLEAIKSFINTLEVKEVNMEKKIDDWYNTMGIPITIDALKGTAHHFFELGLKAQKVE